MLLEQITVKNFRNFTDKEFEFSPYLTIIIGENSRGKTNLLESVYLITQGEGFRESREDELIQFNQDKSVIRAVFKVGGSNFTFQINIKKTSTGVDKAFSVNKAKRKNIQYQKETPKVVLFSPEQIEIMTGPPDKRRKYFNNFLGSSDISYKKNITNYESALRKRNKILEMYEDDEDLYNELAYWNEYLEKQASYITRKRQEYIDYLNKNNRIDSKKFFIKYLKNEFNQKRREENFDLEKRYRKTVIGPQKDDFEISLAGKAVKNLHHFGSRSEQRLAIFWLKLIEIKFIEDNFRVKPVLLLDDIFSELDTKNKKLTLDLVRKYQTVVTTTEKELIDLAEAVKNIIAL